MSCASAFSFPMSPISRSPEAKAEPGARRPTPSGWWSPSSQSRAVHYKERGPCIRGGRPLARFIQLPLEICGSHLEEPIIMPQRRDIQSGPEQRSLNGSGATRLVARLVHLCCSHCRRFRAECCVRTLAIVAVLLRVCATVLLGNHVPCSRPNLKHGAGTTQKAGPRGGRAAGLEMKCSGK